MNDYRRKRVELFKSLIDSTTDATPIRILDVGGRIVFWKETSFWNDSKYAITVVNVEEDKDIDILSASDGPKNIAWRYGNALDLGEELERGHDVLFSNSVIEHVGGIQQIERMAGQFNRFPGRYFLQTPNYWFPMEPHFRVLFFAQLPRAVRALAIRNFNLGFFKRANTWSEARRKACAIRLLTREELMALFPSGELVTERCVGLKKSFYVHNFGQREKEGKVSRRSAESRV